jgi:hypothetical protein
MRLERRESANHPPPAEDERESYTKYGFSFDYPRGMAIWELGLFEDGRVDLNGTIPATESSGCVGGNIDNKEAGILWMTMETAPDLEGLLAIHHRGAEENARRRDRELDFDMEEIMTTTKTGHDMAHQHHSGSILLPGAPGPLYGTGIVGGWYCERSGRAYILYTYHWSEDMATLSEEDVLSEFQLYLDSFVCH